MIYQIANKIRNCDFTIYYHFRKEFKSERKANQKREKKIRLCQTFLRIIYPTFYILFVVIFWLVGMTKYGTEI